MEPSGPEVVVGQLQFEFDGITPLTQEQKIVSWLATQDLETPDVFTALLFLNDTESRRRRAARWSDVRSIQVPYDSTSGWLVSGGQEVSWLYDEACKGYINGAFFSALLCAHSACERVLAGCLYAYREDLANNWLMWGLGKLMQEAFARRIIDDALLAELSKLNELRKVSAHFKPSHETATSVYRRAMLLQDQDPELDDDDAVDQIIHTDALFAIKVATILVRSNLYLPRI
jgi:hypothetical protein